MSETISVLFNMDDYNIILIPPCVPMATTVLLYRVLWDFKELWVEWPASSSSCSCFPSELSRIWSLPKRKVWGDACRCSVSLTLCSSCYLLAFGWRESRLQQGHKTCAENHRWQQDVVCQPGVEAKPSTLAAVAAPRRVENNRLLEKRSCEVGAFVSCW